MTDDAAAWLAPLVSVAAVVALVGVRAFADVSVPVVARAHVALAWMLSLAIVFTVPVDVRATVGARAGVPRGLERAWEVMYWSTYVATFVALPVHASYEDAGDFSTRARLRRAARENGAYLGVMIAACAIGAFAMMATETLSAETMRAYGIVLANVWGISTGTLLMGFGLVDVPRSIWRRASYGGRVSRALRRVTGVSRALTRDRERLASQVKAVATTSGVMPRRHELRWAMTIIENETPEMPNTRGSGADVDADDAEEACLDYDYDELSDLVALRRAVRKSMRAYKRTRAQYVIAVEEAFHAEALEQSRMSVTRRLHRPPNRGVRSGPLARCLDDLEYTLYIVVAPILMRCIAVGLAFFSMSIIVAESTIWVGRVWKVAYQVSLLSVMLEKAMSDESTSVLNSVQVVVAFPLFYMCFCTFYSLFKLGMFSFYQLVPRNTDSISLLVNASLVCRYAAPLSYNFLMLLPVIRSSGKMTTFSKKMASNVPEIAGQFNIIVPTFLGLFCAAVALDWFNKIVRVFHADGFMFTGDADENESVEAGKSIVDRERAEISDGGEIGRTHEAFISDHTVHEQRLPMVEDDESRDDRNLLSRADPESANARWETQKQRLSAATEQSMNRYAARGSPAGRAKVSKLDSMFSNFRER